MRKKLLFSSLFFLSMYAIQAQNYVTLHEDCNYGGKNYFLEAGTYRAFQMKIDNDKLSSLQIPAGMKVTIYENDNYTGRSQTFTANVACLDAAWNDMASSIVVENSNYQSHNNSNFSDYIVFYNDCYSKGFSKTLTPGTYTGTQLGTLKNNISSLTIFGNLQVRVYTTNDDATGYYYTFDATQACLSNTYNDKIRSLVIEYKPAGNYDNGNNNGGYNNGGYNNGNNNGGYNNNNNPGNYATFYTDCNYTGNSIRLMPGNYQGSKLGMFRNNISSVELPSNLRIRAFTNDNLTGNSTTISADNTCLNFSLKNHIGSFIVEETGYNNGNNNNPPSNNGVIIYVDANYRGQAVTLLPGTYSSMSQLNFPDKALSSLVVPAGYRVILYDAENFGGKNYTITESKSSFIIPNWNDRTSSIAVYRDR